jgi:hypothetical protein
MPSQLVILDESKSDKHPIISVGGVAVELDRVGEVERRWEDGKRAVGLGGQPVKYSMTWPEPARRGELIALLGTLPLRAVVALLEDFRPTFFKLSKQRRGERYVHLHAFEWVLQRLAEPTYLQPGCAPHFVAFDYRADFPKLAKEYARHHPAGWEFPGGKRLSSLKSLGYSASLYAACDGPLIEIADMLVSTVTRWAGGRCLTHKGGRVDEYAELARDCRAVRNLLPPSPTTIPTRWQGYSVVTFTRNKTGKELLFNNIDSWLRELPDPTPPTTPMDDDLPF